MVRSKFGAFCFQSERHGSSKKGKKCVVEKPKQPQRGLGVAKLEKIRLQNLMMASCFPSSPFQSGSNIKEDMRGASSSSLSAPPSINTTPFYGLHPHTMRLPKNATAHMIGFHELYSSRPVRFLSKDIEELLLPHSIIATTLPLIPQSPEDSAQKHLNSTVSMSQNSDSTNSHELDLELKL